MCQHNAITRLFHKPLFTAALLTGLMLGTAVASATASGLGVTEKGSGPALVFIPGLNSGSTTFTDTCEAFVTTHHCVLLQLPGFAGQQPVNVEAGFLATMKQEVIALLREKDLGPVSVVGHSLGGVLGMMISLEAPELIRNLVIIDSLPFASALQNPALTEELVKPQADLMRRQMDAVSESDFFRTAAMNMQGMTRSPEGVEQLQQWSQSSDRATTTAAMYELMTLDLRDDIRALAKPVLVLGSWAAYKSYGSTLESTREIFTTQYAAAPDVDVRMSQDGYHFLTWDDGAWVNAQIRDFIGKQ